MISDVGADDLHALAQRYPGVRFLAVTVYDAGVDGRDDHVQLRVSGAANDLLRHGFLIPKWAKLPPCGFRYQRTPGYGRGGITRTKRGFRIDACYDNALDKIAPVLVGRLLERFTLGTRKWGICRGPGVDRMDVPSPRAKGS